MNKEQKKFWNILTKPYIQCCGTCSFNINKKCIAKGPDESFNIDNSDGWCGFNLSFNVDDRNGWSCGSYSWKGKL